MVGGSFARIVSEASLFGDDRIGARRNDDAGREILLRENLLRFVRQDIGAFHVDRESSIPLIVVYAARSIGWEKNACRYDKRIESAIGEDSVLQHAPDTGTICNVAR